MNAMGPRRRALQQRGQQAPVSGRPAPQLGKAPLALRTPHPPDARRKPERENPVSFEARLYCLSEPGNATNQPVRMRVVANQQEVEWVTDAGDFYLDDCVNGVLAPMRSLGDSSMKDFLIGAPYTTDTDQRRVSGNLWEM
ncbi:hypothetical protein C8R42DRAFT_644046 [Lentinula raphanica]|nr:hypothetical protein C8R42DRAFT_644046 [Lentinula raphanica]